MIRKWFSEHFLVTRTIVIVEWHIEVFVFVRFDGRVAPIVVRTSVPRFFPISISVHAGGHWGRAFEAGGNEALAATSTIATSPLNDINDQKDNYEEIDHETNGEDVVPSWGWENFVNQWFVVTIFVCRRFFLQFCVTKTCCALKSRKKNYVCFLLPMQIALITPKYIKQNAILKYNFKM